MGLLDSDAEELKKRSSSKNEKTESSGTGRKVNSSGLGAFKGLNKYKDLTAKYRAKGQEQEAKAEDKAVPAKAASSTSASSTPASSTSRTAATSGSASSAASEASAKKSRAGVEHSSASVEHSSAAPSATAAASSASTDGASSKQREAAPDKKAQESASSARNRKVGKAGSELSSLIKKTTGKQSTAKPGSSSSESHSSTSAGKTSVEAPTSVVSGEERADLVKPPQTASESTQAEPHPTIETGPKKLSSDALKEALSSGLLSGSDKSELTTGGKSHHRSGGLAGRLKQAVSPQRDSLSEATTEISKSTTGGKTHHRMDGKKVAAASVDSLEITGKSGVETGGQSHHPSPSFSAETDRGADAGNLPPVVKSTTGGGLESSSPAIKTGSELSASQSPDQTSTTGGNSHHRSGGVGSGQKEEIVFASGKNDPLPAQGTSSSSEAAVQSEQEAIHLPPVVDSTTGGKTHHRVRSSPSSDDGLNDSRLGSNLPPVVNSTTGGKRHHGIDPASDAFRPKTSDAQQAQEDHGWSNPPPVVNSTTGSEIHHPLEKALQGFGVNATAGSDERVSAPPSSSLEAPHERASSASLPPVVESTTGSAFHHRATVEAPLSSYERNAEAASDPVRDERKQDAQRNHDRNRQSASTLDARQGEVVNPTTGGRSHHGSHSSPPSTPFTAPQGQQLRYDTQRGLQNHERPTREARHEPQGSMDLGDEFETPVVDHTTGGRSHHGAGRRTTRDRQTQRTRENQAALDSLGAFGTLEMSTHSINDLSFVSDDFLRKSSRSEVPEQDGFFQIPHELYQLVTVKIKKLSDQRVFNCLLRLSLGWKRDTCEASHAYIGRWTGIADKSNVGKSINSLIANGYIEIAREPDYRKNRGTVYRVPLATSYLKKLEKIQGGPSNDDSDEGDSQNPEPEPTGGKEPPPVVNQTTRGKNDPGLNSQPVGSEIHHPRVVDHTTNKYPLKEQTKHTHGSGSDYVDSYLDDLIPRRKQESERASFWELKEQGIEVDVIAKALSLVVERRMPDLGHVHSPMAFIATSGDQILKRAMSLLAAENRAARNPHHHHHPDYSAIQPEASSGLQRRSQAEPSPDSQEDSSDARYFAAAEEAFQRNFPTREEQDRYIDARRELLTRKFPIIASRGEAMLREVAIRSYFSDLQEDLNA